MQTRTQRARPSSLASSPVVPRRQDSLRRYHTRSGRGGTCLPRCLLVPGSDAVADPAAEPLGPSLQIFATTPSMMASSVVWFSCSVSCSLSLSAMLTRKKTDQVWPLGRAQRAKTHIWQGALAQQANTQFGRMHMRLSTPLCMLNRPLITLPLLPCPSVALLC